MSALASKVCIMHFFCLLKFVRLHCFLYKFSNHEKLFSCGKVTSIFSGTPGFLHSSELKQTVRVTRHHLLHFFLCSGRGCDCVSWRSLSPLLVSISSLL